MKASDIFSLMLPVLNAQGIVPLLNEQGFINLINLGISETISYKGYLWSWQLFEEEFDITTYQGTLNTKYEIRGLFSIYVKYKNNNTFEEYFYKRRKKGFIIEKEGIFPVIYDNKVRYSFPQNQDYNSQQIEKIRVIYYRGVPPIYQLSDTIEMPDAFKLPIYYFAMNEAIGVYKTFEQNKDINYYQKAVRIIEQLRESDIFNFGHIEVDAA